LVVAAVCDRRVLFISKAWPTLIERRYSFFTTSGGSVSYFGEGPEKSVLPFEKSIYPAPGLTTWISKMEMIFNRRNNIWLVFGSSQGV
jgi:hypothetical protein